MNAYSRKDVLNQVGCATEWEGWQCWLDVHKRQFYKMVDFGLNVRMIWPERMVYGDYSEIMDVIDWLGLERAQDQVHQFIEPRMWKACKRRF